MTNQEIHSITLESLRDWFKKEKWVRISSSGNIAGPCGTSKNKKNPDRCLPKAKAQSLSKAQRAATARKKKKAGAKGKTVVKNTKAAKVTRENNNRSFTKDDMITYIDETIGGYLERYLGYNPGPADHPIYKMNHDQFAAYIAQQFIEGIDELLDETDATIEIIREAVEEAYEDYKKISMGVGHDPDMHFEPEEEKIGADALEMVLQTLDKMATPTKLETANPQDGKAAPYGSGYKPIKKMNEKIKRPSIQGIKRKLRRAITKEDIHNLVVGLVQEIQQKEGTLQEDDRCTRIAKQKYDTWPSAYASGAVVRCRRGEIWKKK